MEQSSVASTRVRVSACSVFRKFGLKSDALIGIVNQQIDRRLRVNRRDAFLKQTCSTSNTLCLLTFKSTNKRCKRR